MFVLDRRAAATVRSRPQCVTLRQPCINLSELKQRCEDACVKICVHVRNGGWNRYFRLLLLQEQRAAEWAESVEASATAESWLIPKAVWAQAQFAHISPVQANRPHDSILDWRLKLRHPPLPLSVTTAPLSSPGILIFLQVKTALSFWHVSLNVSQ